MRYLGFCCAVFFFATFVYEVNAGQVELVSRADPSLTSDTAGGGGLVATQSGSSADGRYYVFISPGPGLAPNDDNNTSVLSTRRRR